MYLTPWRVHLFIQPFVMTDRRGERSGSCRHFSPSPQTAFREKPFQTATLLHPTSHSFHSANARGSLLGYVCSAGCWGDRSESNLYSPAPGADRLGLVALIFAGYLDDFWCWSGCAGTPQQISPLANGHIYRAERRHRLM